MIPLSEFIPLVCVAIPRFQRQAPNERQEACIRREPTAPLAIFAGPGSGKTTVLVLRALRLVFVSGMLPEQVLLTTFTKKAASELRSRLVEWGLALIGHLGEHGTPAQQRRLEDIDINRFVIGTLDSICEDVLTTFRHPSDSVPVLAEGFVGNALLMFKGLFATQAHTSRKPLEDYLSKFTFDGEPPGNFGEIVKLSRTVMDRLIHDRVDLKTFCEASSHTEGRIALVRAMGAYRESMGQNNQMDFAILEELFHNRLAEGRLDRFTAGIKAVLVDEYQDTNPLQESIYFELVRCTGASFTIVGDDDQSLYRFRGATVELFRDFAPRFTRALPSQPQPHLEYLIDNYRSSPEIIQFVNGFIQGDPAFAAARVRPPKPTIRAHLPSNNIPVLGLFRTDGETLANELVQVLCTIFQGDGQVRTAEGEMLDLRRDPDGGDFGDCVFLAHSVNELTRPFMGQPPRERLPLLLRRRLEQRNVAVFNPRGRELRDIPVVRQLLGTLLECIDPNGEQQAKLRLRLDAQRVLDGWRTDARNFIDSNPSPSRPHTLKEFVTSWQARSPQSIESWPSEWPLLELCFKLLSWIPDLQNDPEGQVYLEAISRCISQAATFSSYRSTLVFDSETHRAKSVQAAIQDILVPIAESAVDIDEEIMPHVPRGRLPLMTIHQAKGLEYPLVIVDVGSDFKTDHPKSRFRRFPDKESATQLLEGDLAPFSEIGPLRQSRGALARTFDDLARLYYVAFSRPQSVLLLVGLEQCIRSTTKIKNVATGWRSDGQWNWVKQHSGRKPPPVANNLPLTLL